MAARAVAQSLADRPVPPGGGHQEQESAATGPEKLASFGARLRARPHTTRRSFES